MCCSNPCRQKRVTLNGRDGSRCESSPQQLAGQNCAYIRRRLCQSCFLMKRATTCPLYATCASLSHARTVLVLLFFCYTFNRVPNPGILCPRAPGAPGWMCGRRGRLVREWAAGAVTPPAPHLPFTFHRLALTFTLYILVFLSSPFLFNTQTAVFFPTGTYVSILSYVFPISDKNVMSWFFSLYVIIL